MSETKKTLKVVSLNELRKIAQGELVELPSFVAGVPFVARMRRPSLQSMAKSGKIPNPLLTKANELFFRGMDKTEVDLEDEELLINSYDVYRLVAEASLISPTLEEIESTGLELTDQQLIAIYNYSQIGIEALLPFRG